jgi:archaellum biogenesis protein FlaJ (TadC family)
MKKIVYYLMGVVSTTSSIMFIYYIFNLSDTNLAELLFLLFTAMVSIVLFIMLEPRPKDNDIQRRYDKNIKSQGYSLLMLISAAVIIILFMSSCSASKTRWGCTGSKYQTGYKSKLGYGY